MGAWVRVQKNVLIILPMICSFCSISTFLDSKRIRHVSTLLCLTSQHCAANAVFSILRSSYGSSQLFFVSSSRVSPRESFSLFQEHAHGQLFAHLWVLRPMRSLEFHTTVKRAATLATNLEVLEKCRKRIVYLACFLNLLLFLSASSRFSATCSAAVGVIPGSSQVIMYCFSESAPSAPPFSKPWPSN